MGAYENPRFFNAPNYMAGTQAFISTFTKGLEEGLQQGEKMIAERKEYEKGIYEKGDELKQELDAAVANSQITKDQVQGALRQFYDEALKVDMPTKKGLGGLFAKAQERRLGDLDLMDAQQSFTDAVTGINTAFNYTYDPEVDIMENEDRGHPQFKKKKAIYDAIKNASVNPNFSYSNGKFDGSLEVEIEGKKQKFTTAEIQAIFSASGKEQRDIIDAKHNEMQDGIFNETNAAISNLITRAEVYNYSKRAIAENEAKQIVRRRLGIADDGKLSQATKSFINDEYNNHADISEENKLSILGKYVTSEKISQDELARIADEPMDVSAMTYSRRYNITEDEAKLLKENIERGKTEIVEEAYMQDLRDRGLIDKGFRKKEEEPKGGSGTDTSGDDAYLVQKVRTETAGIVNTVIDSTAFKNAVQPFMMATKGGIPPKELQNDKPIFTSSNDGGFLSDAVIQSLDANQQAEIKDFGNSFLNSEFTFRGSKENASGVEINPDGTVRLKFDGKQIMEDVLDAKGQPTGKKQAKILKDSTLSFNIYDPESMRRYTDAISTEAGGTGTYSRKAYSQGYDQQMLAEYTSNEGLNRLNQPKMEKWINFIDKKGGRIALYNFVINNSSSLSPEFTAYYNKNKEAIDDYMIKNARNN